MTGISYIKHFWYPNNNRKIKEKGLNQITKQKKIFIDCIEENDQELAQMIYDECKRQQDKIELIASENFTSQAVMQAQGSWLTNKYAEGLPGKRYYGGCEHVDRVEQLAIDRVKELYGAEYVNVQPHSGASANNAVYFALLNPGDTIMGMNLSHGGHLTHGSPVNLSGKYFNVIDYGVNQETEILDYDALEKKALEHKPKMIIAGASAYPREIDFKRIGQVAKKINAIFMVDMAHIAGLVAAGEHQNPVESADVVTSTTHKSLRGPRGGFIITTEKWIKQINKAVFPGTQGGPLMHVIAAKAVCFKEAMTENFKQYQKQIRLNAKAMAEELIKQGCRVVSGKTENHLVLVDVQLHKITGKVAEEALDEVGITVNKNTIPFDPESPFVTSGLRIGVPAMTSRGFKELQFKKVAQLIANVIKNIGNKEVEKSVRKDVDDLTKTFPLYQ